MLFEEINGCLGSLSLVDTLLCIPLLFHFILFPNFIYRNVVKCELRHGFLQYFSQYTYFQTKLDTVLEIELHCHIYREHSIS